MPDQLPTDDLLVLTGDSVSPRQVADLARAIAGAMEAHPRFTPTRAARDEPLHTLHAGFRAFTEAELARSPGRAFRVLFGRPEARLDGLLDIFPELDLDLRPRTHVIDAGLPTGVLDVAGRDAFVDWAIDLFDALEVFHGYVTTADMQSQRKRLISEAVDRGDMAAPRFEEPGWTTFDRWLSDVYWVNYFGPAFVDRWGVGRLAAGGIRHDVRPTGAVVVWATEEPPAVESVSRLTDYGYKQGFYKSLGREVFSHESTRVPAPGELVPTLHEHRASNSGRGLSSEAIPK